VKKHGTVSMLKYHSMKPTPNSIECPVCEAPLENLS
jgi:hypothetical protein